MRLTSLKEQSGLNALRFHFIKEQNENRVRA